MRVLIIEDEERIASFLQEGLEAEGFSAVVARTGTEGIAQTADDIEVVILDVMLPDTDGYRVLAALRERRPTLPVLMLTARGDLTSKVSGLDAGADDYMTKPFAFEELLARLRALLRRQAQGAVLTVGGLTLDLQARAVDVGGRRVELTEREFALLAFLMRHPDQILSRQHILSQVWHLTFDPQSTVLETTITRLRHKLAREGGTLPLETVRGAGYRFVLRG